MLWHSPVMVFIIVMRGHFEVVEETRCRLLGSVLERSQVCIDEQKQFRGSYLIYLSSRITMANLCLIPMGIVSASVLPNVIICILSRTHGNSFCADFETLLLSLP